MHPQGIPSSSSAVAASIQAGPRAYLKRFPADAPAEHPLEQQSGGSFYIGRPEDVFGTISCRFIRKARLPSSSALAASTLTGKKTRLERFPADAPAKHPLEQQSGGSVYTSRPKTYLERFPADVPASFPLGGVAGWVAEWVGNRESWGGRRKPGGAGGAWGLGRADGNGRDEGMAGGAGGAAKTVAAEGSARKASRGNQPEQPGEPGRGAARAAVGSGGQRWVAVGCGGLRWAAVGGGGLRWAAVACGGGPALDIGDLGVSCAGF